MTNFVPFEKLSKKKKKEINNMKRNTWYNLNPVTKVIPDKKKYDRKKLPKNFDSFNFDQGPCIIVEILYSERCDYS